MKPVKWTEVSGLRGVDFILCSHFRTYTREHKVDGPSDTRLKAAA